jgi:hypothetical protein
MAHKVFICHSSKDKLVADAACAALEAQKVSCWIAPRDILPGDEYGRAIIEALSSCQIVLLIFSKPANESPQVRREIERAVSKEKIIVPFRIEDILPSDAMEFALGNTHWLDALTPPMERRLSELCESVSRLLLKHPVIDDLVTQAASAATGPATDANGRFPEQTFTERPPAAKNSDPIVDPRANLVRACPLCKREYPVRYLHCSIDGASLGEAQEPSPKAPVDTRPARVIVVAKPKLSLGVLNAADVSSVAVVLNGAEFEMGWGSRTFDVPPGVCSVTVGIRNPLYSSLKSCASLTLQLQPGNVTYLRYTSGLTYFQHGTLDIDPRPQSMPPPPTPPPREGGKTCLSCSRSMPAVAVFCPSCGQRQTKL